MKSFLSTLIKGFVLGLSMVVPGLSGGTLAFIMGIYEKLIEEISTFKRSHIKQFFLCFFSNQDRRRKSFLSLKEEWDWAFLFPLSMGMFLALVLFVRFAGDWIDTYSLLFYSFVVGLILASLILPFQKIRKSFQTFLIFMLSFSLNLYFFTRDVETLNLEATAPFFVPIGFLVAITLIIPGASGSYLLLVLGLYEKTLSAVKNWEILTLSLFLLGLALGFVLTAKFIKRVLTRHWDNSLAIILGLILGSVYSIYPLKELGFVWSYQHFTFFLWMSLGFFSILGLHLCLNRQQRRNYK